MANICKGGGFNFTRRESSRAEPAIAPAQKVSAEAPPSAQPQQQPKVSFRPATPPTQAAPKRRSLVEDQDKTLRPNDQNRPLHHRSSTTALISPSMTSTAAILPDSELRTIGTYGELLNALHERYISTRSQPPADIPGELATTLKFAYPELDEARPVRFFESLSDEAYESAGRAIIEKKRELEDKIASAGRKKRKVVLNRMHGLEDEADIKIRRLEALREVRRKFAEGVAGLLRQGGLSL